MPNYPAALRSTSSSSGTSRSIALSSTTPTSARPYPSPLYGRKTSLDIWYERPLRTSRLFSEQEKPSNLPAPRGFGGSEPHRTESFPIDTHSSEGNPLARQLRRDGRQQNSAPEMAG